MVTPLIPFRAVIHLRQVYMGLYSAILLFPLAKRLVFLTMTLLIKTESYAMSPFGLNFSYRYQQIRRTGRHSHVINMIVSAMG